MDKTEQMAADIALAMNGGEWKDGKWYSKGHREAWIKAVQPYADEIERFQEKCSLLRGQIRLHIDDYKIVTEDLYAEIGRLREALKGLLQCPAIADGNHNEPAWYDPKTAMTAMAEKKARAALKEGE